MGNLIYDLECEYGHKFEGWFRSAVDYKTQKSKGYLSCPECQTQAIRKLPSKLNFSKKIANTGPEAATSTNNNGHFHHHEGEKNHNDLPLATGFVMAKQVMQALVRHSEDVGNDFAEEVRKIYYEEAPIRAIRGNASLQEYEQLREEGIDIIPLPSINAMDDD